MRTESEILAMRDRLTARNDKLWERMRTHPSDCQDEELVFNNNGGLLCALKWVLGEDTIRVHWSPGVKQEGAAR